jgi:prepilin-type N-terminal cleavage/methylation domain-containing protein
MRERGVSLVELLVAMAVSLAVAAAVAALIDPAGGTFAAQSEATDVHQRMRVAAATLRDELASAGAGVTRGLRRGPLNGFFAPVLPYRLDEEPVVVDGGAVTIVYVPDTSAQAATAHAIRAASTTVLLQYEPGCPPADAACGFVRNEPVIVYDDAGGFSLYTVTSTAGASLQLRHERPDAPYVFAAGSTIASVVARTYVLRDDPSSGVSQLARVEGGRIAPVVDHVVGLAFEYAGAPAPPRVIASTPEERLPTTYGPPPLAAGVPAYPPGENCVFTRDATGLPVPRLPVLAADSSADVRLTPAEFTDGPWCPHATHPGRFDADALRIRRVTARIRIEAGVDAVRGPAGVLFARGGTARSGRPTVPDVEVQIDVAPRNLDPRR